MIFGEDVGELEADVFLLVDALEDETEEESNDAEASEHHQRPSIVITDGGSFGSHRAVGHSLDDIGIGLIEDLTDEHGEEPEADILDPEDEGVSRTDNLGIHELRNAGPKSGGHERERSAEHEDSEIRHHYSTDSRTLEQGEDESEGEVASDKKEGSEHEHRSCFTLIIDVITENRSDADSQEGEYGEDGSSRLTHIAHIAIGYKSHNSEAEHRDLHNLTLAEIACKRGTGYYDHDNILDHGHHIRCPHRVGGKFGESEPLLQAISARVRL